MNIVVIIPTFGEAENINRLLGVLKEEFEQIKEDNLSVLIVDGKSPDGTGEIVKNFAKDHAFVHLVEKEKGGLGADYIFGMKYAMRDLSADAVIEMDADFQHDPRDLKRFVSQLDAGYDYVIGSRYIEGGSIPKDWAIYRRILSVCGNAVARVILWLPQVTDYTTGFKASRVKGFLDSIDLDRIYSKGYAYKIHLLSEMIDRRARVKEIPITFGARSKGVSKMEGNNLLDSLRVVLRIRLRKSERFVKFLTVGFFGLIIQWIILLRLRAEMPAFLATAIGGEAAIISNFTFNNLWTFREKVIVREKIIFKFLQFNLISIGAVLIQSLVVLVGNILFGRGFIVDNSFFFLGLAFVVIWNFIFYSKVIWKVR